MMRRRRRRRRSRGRGRRRRRRKRRRRRRRMLHVTGNGLRFLRLCVNDKYAVAGNTTGFAHKI